MPMRTSGPSILFDFFAASQRVKLLLADAMADCGLRPDEYAVYSALVDGGPTGPTRLAEAVGMPPTTMSHYVRTMLARGHLRRHANPVDGRSAILALTRSGRTAHRRAAVAFEEGNRRFVAELEVTDADARNVLRAVRLAAQRAADVLAADTTARAG